MRMGYPRKGEPLAPGTLREILVTPAPRWARDRGFEHLADLDARAWEAFTPETCRRLANLVVDRVRKRISSAPRELLRRTPGALPGGLTLRDMALDVRTSNALARARLAARPADLAKSSVGALGSIPGIGARSLVDLLTAWEHAQRQTYRLTPPLTVTAPDVRSTRSRSKPHRAVPTRDIEPARIDEPLVDRALDRLLETAGPRSERARAGLAARLGWSDGSPATLEAAGRIAGLTRERMRQIQKRFQDQVRGRYRVPALERAVGLLGTVAPTRTDRAAEILVDEGVAARPIHPAVIRRVADLLGLEPRFQILDLQPIGGIVAPTDADVDSTFLRNVLAEIKRRARPFGFIHRDAIAEIVHEVVGKRDAGTGDLFLRFGGAKELGNG